VAVADTEGETAPTRKTFRVRIPASKSHPTRLASSASARLRLTSEQRSSALLIQHMSCWRAAMSSAQAPQFDRRRAASTSNMDEEVRL